MTETLEETRARIRLVVSGRGVATRWISEHLDHADNSACLIWPFSIEVGRYPRYSDRNIIVHRMMCEYRHGVPPTPQHHSAHSCDCGTDGCVNPMHVSWKTPSGNQKDRYDGKPIRPRHKLTTEVAEQIRGLKGVKSPKDIAEKFGVSARNVRLIFAGEAWKKGSDPRIFTPQEVASIRGQRGLVSARKLAPEFQASRNQIERIMAGKTYRWVNEDEDPHFP